MLHVGGDLDSGDGWSQNTVLQICFGLFTHLREFVQLCYKHDIDVVLCSSGAIFAAVCSDFSHVVFSQL